MPSCCNDRKHKHRNAALVFGILCHLLFLVCCDSRNPASIYEARKGRPTPTPPERLVRFRQPAQAAVPVPDAPRPTLKPGKPVTSNSRPVEATLKKMDLAGLLRTGGLTIEANDPQFVPRLSTLFDGAVDQPARTEDVNPLLLTLRFAQPIRLKTVRLFPSYASYNWVLSTSDEDQGLMVRDAPAEEWSRIDLGQAMETQLVRIALLRIERDNYVHVNEVELYAE